MTVKLKQVGDVAWAPYSSTVFAAVTVDGKVEENLVSCIFSTCQTKFISGSHLRPVHQQIQPSLCAGCRPQEKGHGRSKYRIKLESLRAC